jgi:hypothetical protein
MAPWSGGRPDFPKARWSFKALRYLQPAFGACPDYSAITLPTRQLTLCQILVKVF